MRCDAGEAALGVVAKVTKEVWRSGCGRLTA